MSAGIDLLMQAEGFSSACVDALCHVHLALGAVVTVIALLAALADPPRSDVPYTGVRLQVLPRYCLYAPLGLRMTRQSRRYQPHHVSNGRGGYFGALLGLQAGAFVLGYGRVPPAAAARSRQWSSVGISAS